MYDYWMLCELKKMQRCVSETDCSFATRLFQKKMEMLALPGIGWKGGLSISFDSLPDNTKDGWLSLARYLSNFN